MSKDQSLIATVFMQETDILGIHCLPQINATLQDLPPLSADTDQPRKQPLSSANSSEMHRLSIILRSVRTSGKFFRLLHTRLEANGQTQSFYVRTGSPTKRHTRHRDVTLKERLESRDDKD